MWSDPTADFLTRVRNAVRNRSKQVTTPYSRLRAAVCKVLLDEGYINGFDRIDDGKQGQLRVQLKYGPRGEPVIRHLKRESRAGRRVFRGYNELPRVLNGMGIVVVSTSRGLLSDRRCREWKIGGEVVCSVY